MPLGVLPSDIKPPLSRGDVAKLRQALQALDKQRKLAEAKLILETVED